MATTLVAFRFQRIDRVEVLLDGASAIYGADAIFGVINVILKALQRHGGEAQLRQHLRRRRRREDGQPHARLREGQHGPAS